MAAETQLCDAARSSDCAKLRDLLAAGADASYFDGEGMTPLMHAAKHGHAEAVQCLLEAGAPWNAVTPTNLSAGDFAMEKSHQESFDLLLNAGIQAELVLGTIARAGGGGDSSAGYLEERILFNEDKILDSDSKAVMMAWEKPLMESHARAICGGNGGRILNIGFGMGLVDTAIQRYSPASHTIIEAHPDVYDRMIKSGWGEKENVKIVFGRWQDVLPQLESYDGIFFDTYGEYYEDLRQFHQHLPKLLKPGGIYSYFNGLCGGNAFFHVVYCQLVSLELGNLGYSTEFIPLPVKDCLPEEVWEGVKHKYWQLDIAQAFVSDGDGSSGNLLNNMNPLIELERFLNASGSLKTEQVTDGWNYGETVLDVIELDGIVVRAEIFASANLLMWSTESQSSSSLVFGVFESARFVGNMALVSKLGMQLEKPKFLKKD